jgi:hypothetical protein
MYAAENGVRRKTRVSSHIPTGLTPYALQPTAFLYASKRRLSFIV